MKNHVELLEQLAGGEYTVVNAAAGDVPSWYSVVVLVDDVATAVTAAVDVMTGKCHKEEVKSPTLR
jgi:hypothetical protein